MSDKIIAATLKLNGEDANNTVKSFKTQLKEANNELLQAQSNFGATSREALQAAQRVAELRDSIQEASEVAGLFDPGAKFQAFGNVLKTVTGGFSAITGTMALFGEKSEDVEKALLKVQAAMAITEGVNTIVDSVKDFERLGAIIQQTTIFKKADTVATTLATAAQKLFGVAAEESSKGFKVLKGAIAGLGIGLLVTAIGYLVTNFDKLKKAVLDFIPGLSKVAEFIGGVVEAVTDFVGVTSEAERATERLAKAAEENLKKTEIYLDLNADKFDQYTNRKYQVEIDYQKKKKALDEDEKLSESDKTSFLAQARDQRNRLLIKADADRAAESQKIRDEEQKKIEDANKKAADEARKRNEELKKRDDERAKDKFAFDNAEAESERNKAEKYKATQGLLAGGTATIDSGALQIETNNFINQSILDANKAHAEAMLEQRNEYQSELDERDKSDLDKLNEWYSAKSLVIGANEDLQYRLKQDYEDKKTKLEQAAQKQRLDIASNLLGQASTLFAKHTAAYKVIAVAQATIQTFQSAQGAFAGMVSSIPGPVGIALGVAAAALAVATGIKNISNIIKTKVPGAEGGGSVPSISASAGAPLDATPQVGTTTLDQASINGVGNAASGRTFVLESDVTDNQERITRLNRAARLGG